MKFNTTDNVWNSGNTKLLQCIVTSLF